MPLVRDDNYSTCAVFTSDMAMPWFTDFSLPVSYFNHSVTATVELFGDNVGCSSGDDGKLFIFPISSWNESAGMFGPRKTCSFQESSTIVETGQQKCAYNCTFSQQTVALRVIKRPHSEVQSGWQLCEVSNLFYGMLIKRNSRNTNDNFRIGVSFDCVKSYSNRARLSFTENPSCRLTPVGGNGGVTTNHRDCWIRAGRIYPTGMKFIVGTFLLA